MSGREERVPLLRASDEAHMHGDKAALERLVAFSDAVVAIAITLIVLPLVDHAIDAENATEFFAGNVIGLITALLSFVIVGVFWRAHHLVLAQATGSTRNVMRVEFLWLASVVFLPVATALDFAGHGPDVVALASYFGTLLVASVSLRLQRVLLEHAGLIPVETISFLDRWLGSLLLAVAFVLVLLVPLVGAAWLLVQLVEPVSRRIFGRRMERPRNDKLVEDESAG